LRSPFLLRNLGILLLVAGNLAVAVLAARKVQGVALRAGAALYLTLSLFGFLLAASLFHTLELSPRAASCWRTNSEWPKVKLGMKRREVVAFLGAPKEIRFGVNDIYDLHPLGMLNTGVVSYDAEGDDAVVESKRPETRVAWLPPGPGLAEHLRGDALVMSAIGLVLLAILSLLPFGARQGWRSWMLYTPVPMLVLALVYEKLVTGGWRFDLFFLGPAYLVIAGTWLLRFLRR